MIAVAKTTITILATVIIGTLTVAAIVLLAAAQFMPERWVYRCRRNMGDV